LAVIPLPLTTSPATRDRVVVVRARGIGASALRGVLCDCHGVVALEFVILLGPLLLLLLGIFDIGLLTLTNTRINFAVEAAAKCGAIGTTCTSPSDTAA